MNSQFPFIRGLQTKRRRLHNPPGSQVFGLLLPRTDPMLHIRRTIFASVQHEEAGFDQGTQLAPVSRGLTQRQEVAQHSGPKACPVLAMRGPTPMYPPAILLRCIARQLLPASAIEELSKATMSW